MTRKKHTEIEDNKKCMWAVTRSAVTGVILKILGSWNFVYCWLENYSH